MNILFIHGNFPGQFLYLAPALASHRNNVVKFMTFAEGALDNMLHGVTVHAYPYKSRFHNTSRTNQLKFLQASERGEIVIKSLIQMQRNGFIPDVIVCHGGMGYGLYIKALYPHTKLISYMEWYFALNDSQPSTAKKLQARVLTESRNSHILHECLLCDQIVCPTPWQARQFPDVFSSKITILFDGINVQMFHPKKTDNRFLLDGDNVNHPICIETKDLILTYGTRGMEPLRGFPEFMRAASKAMLKFPELKVIIFGSDRSCYGPKSSHPSGSWKQALLDELKNEIDLSRIYFPGLITMEQLAFLLSRSNLHCSFTRPHVVSWGLFNAAACGANILTNRFAGFDDVFANKPVLKPVDLNDQESVTQGVLQALSDAQKNSNKESRISNLKAGLDLDSCLTQWIEMIDRWALDSA